MCFIKIIIIKKESSHNKADKTKLKSELVSVYAIPETEEDRIKKLQSTCTVYKFIKEKDK